jgi:glycosyltransferase involved in cell wall biosynthesis
VRPARERICFVVSSPLTIRAFLTAHIAALSAEFEVSVAANAGPDTFATEGLNARIFRVPLERRISPLRDLSALLHLVRLFTAHRFRVVHSVTPKAGLLAMLAAWLARVPVRIHTFTGQVWATRRGAGRVLLRAMDGLIARLATHVLVDSPSQRDFLIESGVVSVVKASVLANGSICGVDGGRFRPDAAARTKIRNETRVRDDAVVFLYLGRLSRDKGVLDLARAFAGLAAQHAGAHLVLVGPDEEGLRGRVEDIVGKFADWVSVVDFTARPEENMAAADVFCLPSYREGFGQVAIEAAATGLPVIASRIYGIVDAVVEGETGLLHAPADVEALRSHMETLMLRPNMRRRLGEAGRARALRDFSAERVTRALLDYYAGVTSKL